MIQHRAAHTKQKQQTSFQSIAKHCNSSGSARNINSSSAAAAPSQEAAMRASKAAANTGRQYQEPILAVRVPAKVAPQIVSAVPGCRSQSKQSASLDSLASYSENHHNLPYSNRLDQPLQLSIMRNNNQQHQLLLIVDQEHQMSQPVVGRRVPEKSMGSHEHRNLLTTIAQHQQPVAGRRADREQQQILLESEQRLVGKKISSGSKNGEVKLMKSKSSRKLLQVVEQQPMLCNDPNCNKIAPIPTPCYCCCCIAAAAAVASQKQQHKHKQHQQAERGTTLCQAACCAPSKTSNSTSSSRKLRASKNHEHHRSSCSANMPDHELVTLTANHHSHQHPQYISSGTSTCCGKILSSSHHLHNGAALSSSSTRTSCSLLSAPPVPSLKPQLRLLTTAMSAHEHWSELPQPGHFRLLQDSLEDSVKSTHVDHDEHHKASVYDSLAAELKAKLGDPKLGPILLPPKDYDTISRQQGRLTGIEKRRSTNPLLVRQNKTWQLCIEEHCETSHQQPQQDATQSPDKLSDRGQTNMDKSCENPINRSRSNSSSGLGSISAEAQSQSSRSPSQSSSSDDMSLVNSSRRPHPHTKHINDDNNRKLIGSQAASAGGLKSGRPVSSICSSPSVASPQKRFDSCSSASSSGSTCSAALASRMDQQHMNNDSRGRGIQNHNPSEVSCGVLWNGRVEVPLKINTDRNGSQTYLATKQIIY